MADLYDYIDSTGVIVPDTSMIVTDVQNEYKDAFGSDLVVTPDTPQGVLINAEAIARTAVVNNNAQLANTINPNVAGGTALDAIWALTGGTRAAATPTVVTNCTLAGVAGTFIPSGSQAQTANGDVFQSVSPVTLDGSGNGIVNFQSITFGPIACGNGALNQIISNVLGWETITNNQGGSPASVTTLGTLTQSDQSARAQRNNTLAFQGVALPTAITSALYNVAGVTSLSFRENFNSVPMGMLIEISGGATLSGEIWGMTTTGGTGTNGAIVVGTDPMNFAESLQDIPAINPWPIANFSTTGNVTLSGLGTQGGGDWSSSLTAGQIILVKDNTAPAENGLWVAAAGSWARQAYNLAGAEILGSNSGISMIKNSIYSCVAGGTDIDVAAALLENKSFGCAWNGNTTVNIIEPASEQSYSVQFDRPFQQGILIRVTTPNGNAQNIEQAILDYAAGNLQGFTGFIVGADVYPFDIAGAINSVYPQYFISNVEVSVVSPISYVNTPIAIGLNEQAYTQVSYITVNIP